MVIHLYNSLHKKLDNSFNRGNSNAFPNGYSVVHFNLAFGSGDITTCELYFQIKQSECCLSIDQNMTF